MSKKKQEYFNVKTCSKCKLSKSLYDFYKSKPLSQGRRSWCKTCERDKHKVKKFLQFLHKIGVNSANSLTSGQIHYYGFRRTGWPSIVPRY